MSTMKYHLFLKIMTLGIFCTPSNSLFFPFNNISKSWDERVNDLVSRLSLDEMVQQMANGGGVTAKPTPPIPRLNIKPYNFDTECLRGIVWNPSTAFPQAIALAATFSPSLLYEVAEAISTEARAIYHNASSHGEYPVQKSISCLAPFINIMRHPLWGRVQEVYGEDPYLSGELAAFYVRGLQGNHSRYIRANAGCKVVSVHSGPENRPTSRFSFNSIVSERDLRLTYLPNFKACVKAGSYNLMCSYNSINGVPACADKRLLQDILRGEYGFKGYYISDEGAIENVYKAHHFVNSSLEAAVACVNAGVNLELPPAHPSYPLLTGAVMKGLVSFDTIVERVKPLFYTRMRLGEFDPPSMNPYSKINTDVIQNAEHRELAIKTATKSFVLLKNNGELPLRNERFSKMAMVGPMSNNLAELYGDYSPTPVVKYAKTPYEGLHTLADHTSLADGCKNSVCKIYNRTAVKLAITGADLVVICLGTGPSIEYEGNDRVDLQLPGHQLNLLKDVITYVSPGIPVILLIFSAGPVDIRVAVQSDTISAILQCWYPAQATGEALYRVLSGAPHLVVSPGGRLPYTWPQTLDQVPAMVNYSMEGRTYRYFKGQPLFPFGYGLTYTTFHYGGLDVPSSIMAGENLTISVTVGNTGVLYQADEIVQVYISWVNCSVAMPQLQMVGVRRYTLAVAETRRVTFTVTDEQMMIWHDTKGFIHHVGMMSVYVGGQQPNQHTTVPSNVLQTRFKITL